MQRYAGECRNGQRLYDRGLYNGRLRRHGGETGWRRCHSRCRRCSRSHRRCGRSRRRHRCCRCSRSHRRCGRSRRRRRCCGSSRSHGRRGGRRRRRGEAGELGRIVHKESSLLLYIFIERTVSRSGCVNYRKSKSKTNGDDPGLRQLFIKHGRAPFENYLLPSMLISMPWLRISSA